MRRNIRYMYAIALLQGMVFYGPVATLYREAQGVSIAQITLIESISLALCILLEVPWGVLADKLGYKRTMIGCCLLYFLSKIVFWQADGFGGFLLERVMLSVVIAGMSGVDTSILYLSCEKEDSQQVFGWYNSLQTAGLLIAALTFSLFIGDNYALAGGLTVLSYGAAALCALGLTEVKAPAPFSVRQAMDVLRQTLTNRWLLLFLLSAALLTEAHQTITTFFNQLQYARWGLSSAAIGILYIAAVLLGLSGVWSARLTNKTGPLWGGRASLLRRRTGLYRPGPQYRSGILRMRHSGPAPVQHPVPALPDGAAKQAGRHRTPGHRPEHPRHGHRRGRGVYQPGVWGSGGGRSDLRLLVRRRDLPHRTGPLFDLVQAAPPDIKGNGRRWRPFSFKTSRCPGCPADPGRRTAAGPPPPG